MRLIVVSTLALCALALVPVARALPLTFTAHLDGPSEAPPNSSPGTGTAIVVYDDAAHTFTFHVTFSGLDAGTTAAHIHCCVPPDPVGVAVTPTTLPSFPLGVTSGTYDHVVDLTDAASYTADFLSSHGGTPATAEAGIVTGMLNGQAYFNIHTTLRRGGEIRGFLAVVPEPATLTLFAGAVAGFAALRRRRA